jgi:hypothetical protein
MTLRAISQIRLQDWFRPFQTEIPFFFNAVVRRLGEHGIAAVWVTNDPAVHAFVHDEWLPQVYSCVP